MGYANDSLGDYRATRDTVGGKSGTVLGDTIWNLFRSRFPGFRTGDWVKVVVAPPPPPPLITTIQNMLKPTAPPPSYVPVGPTVVPVLKPAPVLAPAPQTPAQVAAPLVAAAAGPVLGPIAATIPPIVDAAAQPPSTRIRIVPDAGPSVSLTPTGGASDAGGGVALPDAAPAEASVTGGGSPLDMVKNLPPAALAAGAGLILFLLSRRR